MISSKQRSELTIKVKHCSAHNLQLQYGFVVDDFITTCHTLITLESDKENTKNGAKIGVLSLKTLKLIKELRIEAVLFKKIFFLDTELVIVTQERILRLKTTLTKLDSISLEKPCGIIDNSSLRLCKDRATVFYLTAERNEIYSLNLLSGLNQQVAGLPEKQQFLDLICSDDAKTMLFGRLTQNPKGVVNCRIECFDMEKKMLLCSHNSAEFDNVSLVNFNKTNGLLHTVHYKFIEQTANDIQKMQQTHYVWKVQSKSMVKLRKIALFESKSFVNDRIWLFGFSGLSNQTETHTLYQSNAIFKRKDGAIVAAKKQLINQILLKFKVKPKSPKLLTFSERSDTLYFSYKKKLYCVPLLFANANNVKQIHSNLLPVEKTAFLLQ